MARAIVMVWAELAYADTGAEGQPTPAERRDQAVETLQLHADQNGAGLVIVRTSAYYEPQAGPGTEAVSDAPAAAETPAE